MFRIDIIYVCNRLKDISTIKNQSKKDKAIREFIDELIYNLGVDVLEMQLKTGIKLGDHPDIVKGFAKIADMMSEDKIVSTESENVDQGKDIEQEISKIMNDRTGPYWNKGHPEHDIIVQQVYTLRSMINVKWSFK